MHVGIYLEPSSRCEQLFYPLNDGMKNRLLRRERYYMCMTIPGWIESKRETEREGGEGGGIGRERKREWGRGERGRRRKRELKSLCACVCVMRFLSGFFLLKMSNSMLTYSYSVVCYHGEKDTFVQLQLGLQGCMHEICLLVITPVQMQCSLPHHQLISLSGNQARASIGES